MWKRARQTAQVTLGFDPQYFHCCLPHPSWTLDARVRDSNHTAPKPKNSHAKYRHKGNSPAQIEATADTHWAVKARHLSLPLPPLDYRGHIFQLILRGFRRTQFLFAGTSDSQQP